MTKFKRQLVPGGYLTAADMLQVLSQQQLCIAAVDSCVLLVADPAIAWLLDSCCVGTFVGETHVQACANSSMQPHVSHGAGVVQEAAADSAAAGAAGVLLDCSMVAASAGCSHHSRAVQIAAAAGVNRASDQLQQQYLKHQQQVVNRRQRRVKRAAATGGTASAGNSAIVAGGIVPPPAVTAPLVTGGICDEAAAASSASTSVAAAEAAVAAEACQLRHQGQQSQEEVVNMELEAVHIVQLDLPEAFYLVHVLHCCQVFAAPQAAGGPTESGAEQLEQPSLKQLQGGAHGQQAPQIRGQLNHQEAVQELTVQQFWCWCCGSAEAPLVFVSQYAAYHHFRSKGWLPRPGLLYGADYVLYQLHPEHAHSDFVVSVVVEKGAGGLEAAPPVLLSAGGAMQLSTPASEQLLDVSTVRQHAVQQECLEGHETSNIRTGMSWLDAQILQRLARQVLKQLLLLYVVVPDGLQLHDPECIQQLAVREVLVKRWVPTEHRDDGK